MLHDQRDSVKQFRKVPPFNDPLGRVVHNSKLRLIVDKYTYDSRFLTPETKNVKKMLCLKPG